MSVARSPRQPAEIQNARNVLGLERRQGCQDRAVVGGLAMYLANWRGRVAQSGDRALLALAGRVMAALDGYADLPPAERAARLDAALVLLEDGVDGEALTPAGGRVPIRPPLPVRGRGGGGSGRRGEMVLGAHRLKKTVSSRPWRTMSRR